MSRLPVTVGTRDLYIGRAVGVASGGGVDDAHRLYHNNKCHDEMVLYSCDINVRSDGSQKTVYIGNEG